MSHPALLAEITGGCLCGSVRFAVAAEPLTSVYCQCRDCQRDSGTGHSCHLMFEASAVTLTGPLKVYHSEADSGKAVARGFCGNCGSSISFETQAFHGHLFLTAGTLDDPELFKPGAVLFTSSAPSWDVLSDALPRYEKMPPLSPAGPR